jgi:NADH:ubiquinone oxidoreductase subunit 4 (subunit M)
MGVFGMFKFNISILNSLILYYYPLITILTLFSSIYISILIFQQNDIKKIIAYSSIIHMNVLILGLFSNNDLGIQGSTFTMFSHSLISSGLFLSIGILYKKFETRNLLNYSGFFFKNPLFSFFFLSFLIANCSFPFTSNFAGELYLLLAILKKNIIISM